MLCRGNLTVHSRWVTWRWKEAGPIRRVRPEPVSVYLAPVVDTGPSPVDRRKAGSKHHLNPDGRGTSLKVITTAANVNDITQTLNLVDGTSSGPR